jgi:hypothetical protein
MTIQVAMLKRHQMEPAVSGTVQNVSLVILNNVIPVTMAMVHQAILIKHRVFLAIRVADVLRVKLSQNVHSVGKSQRSLIQTDQEDAQHAHQIAEIVINLVQATVILVWEVTICRITEPVQHVVLQTAKSVIVGYARVASLVTR